MNTQKLQELKTILSDDPDALGFDGTTAAEARALGLAESVSRSVEPSKKEVLQALKSRSGGAGRYAAFQAAGLQAQTAVAAGTADADTTSLFGFWKQWEEWPLSEPMDVNDAAFQGGWDALILAGLFVAEDKSAAVALGSETVDYWTANGFSGLRDGHIEQARSL